ncbi:gdsl esterase/lipase [Quercus suber]|uniref:Gdsl esterase/lipase n=1 Tax=Quercus suber TaxID=58331 RepID=A0AAW0LRL9_QUESU
MHFLFKKLSSSSSAIVLFRLITFVLFCNTNAVIKLPGNATIQAIIAFGDSIMDTSNSNHLKTQGKCNFRPYGRAFIGKKPTGRWTNGKAPTELIGTLKFQKTKLRVPYILTFEWRSWELKNLCHHIWLHTYNLKISRQAYALLLVALDMIH